MDQTNSVTMSMLQNMAAQAAGLPKTGKTDDDQLSDFQKLLDEKAQEKDPLFEEPAKAPAKAETPAKKVEKAPVQKQESTLERVKRLAEQGYPITQPPIAAVTLDGQVYQPGEYVNVWTPTGVEFIPVADLSDVEMMQLQQVLNNAGPIQVIDVSDPEADAILEATAPGADNSPAALLEEVVSDQVGQVAEEAVSEVKPQSEDDPEMELLDMEQAPQQIFHDVKAAPVKVGEVETPQQLDEADVVRQVDAQIAQALQRGESTVTVKLNPENLGEVTVQVSMKENGILAIAISARNDDTRALLDRHAVNLQELLSSRVRETVEVDIQRGQENQQSQNQQHSYDGHNGHPQDERQERRQQRAHTSSQDFMQQLRLGLIPTDGEF